ncbi:uncharacterized protein RAG0_02102 [Rhynchosporium agropyri]|uniref:Uncharacterized protein n=1 Tax=Rhynchosporium agropyri TaxID=914238 RepID=A0A1E1K4J6_9HELO|nr:uncharacterized protein RAG0_02102 [Rhynchosporium agropyri]
MRLSTTFLSVIALLIHVAMAKNEDNSTLIIIPINPSISALPIEEIPATRTPLIDPPAATSALFIDPIPEPPRSSSMAPEIDRAVPQITTSPAAAEQTSITVESVKTTMTSTTESAIPMRESAKTIYSTTAFTDNPTGQPETTKTATTSTVAPSQTIVPFEGGAGSLRFEVQCTAFALMGVLGVFMLV